MVGFERIIGKQVFRGPLVSFVPLIAAGIGAGASIYTSRQSDKAADEAAQTQATARKEAMSLEQTRTEANINRDKAQANQRSLANASAEEIQISGIEDAANEDARLRAQQEALAAKNPDADYAAKFNPGQVGKGIDSAQDFLVPKISDDTGLIRKSTGGAGLTTPLTFKV